MQTQLRSLDDDNAELLAFKVAEQDYAVDIMSVREIRSSTHVTSLPHSPSFVRGVINLRGVVLPILDLARRLGISDETVTTRNVTIVVDSGGRSVGLLVDTVSDIITIPKDTFQRPPNLSAEHDSGFINALALVEGKLLRVLDLSNVVPIPSEDAA